MAPLRLRNSTRAGKARSVKSPPGPRRNPIPSKTSKFSATADVLRDAERIRATQTAEPLPVSPTQVACKTREGVPITALRDIRHRLDIASAVAYVCAAALKAQTANNDVDVALCLQRCVGDQLFEQMQHISRLLGEAEDEHENAS